MFSPLLGGNKIAFAVTGVQKVRYRCSNIAISARVAVAVGERSDSDVLVLVM